MTSGLQYLQIDKNCELGPILECNRITPLKRKSTTNGQVVENQITFAFLGEEFRVADCVDRRNKQRRFLLFEPPESPKQKLFILTCIVSIFFSNGSSIAWSKAFKLHRAVNSIDQLLTSVSCIYGDKLTLDQQVLIDGGIPNLIVLPSTNKQKHPEVGLLLVNSICNSTNAIRVAGLSATGDFFGQVSNCTCGFKK